MENLDWTTSFDARKRTMTHSFGPRICVVSDFKTKESKVYKDGRETRTIGNDVPLDTYTLFLVSVAEDARKLDSFNHD